MVYDCKEIDTYIITTIFETNGVRPMSENDSSGVPIFLIGMRDSETHVIEKIIERLNVPGYFALHNGHFVNSSNAYSANGMRPCSSQKTQWRLNKLLQNPRNRLYFVECFSQEIYNRCTENHRLPPKQIDHHYPGDPGYDVNPSRFMRGASIGQLIHTLITEWNIASPMFTWKATARAKQLRAGINFLVDDSEHWVAVYHDRNQSFEAAIPEEILYTAAADHCLAAAYQGDCPGISPRFLMHFRIKRRSASQGRSEKDIHRSIGEARKMLRERVVDGIVDLTQQPLEYHRDLPEAAAQEGMRVITQVYDRQSNQLKLITFGYDQPKAFQAWMDEQIDLGREVYGCPNRGYAGAFVDTQEENPMTVP